MFKVAWRFGLVAIGCFMLLGVFMPMASGESDDFASLKARKAVVWKQFAGNNKNMQYETRRR